MIRLNDNFLLDIMKDNYGIDREEFSENEFAEITELYIDNDSFVDSDLEDLKYFLNLEKIVIKDMFVNVNLLKNICSIKSLVNLSFYNCNIVELDSLAKSNITTLVIDNCIYEDITPINDLVMLKELYLDNNDVIDLKDIPIIRRLNLLSLNNTNILNEDYMIYMDCIEYLAIADSGFSDLSILLAMDHLKVLVIDKKQAIENKEFVMELKEKNIIVVDYFNRDVVIYYE